MSSQRPLRVAFIHPDLGIGGAERLVVDAALGLVSSQNYSVEIFTSHHDPSRCFSETRDGTLSVHVLGDSLIPRSFGGRFVIICAILRQLHLTLSLFWATILYKFNKNFTGAIEPFDVLVVDQLSACIPLLRWLLNTRVLFYCHFPDLLLSPGTDLSSAALTGAQRNASLTRTLYRLPFDLIEQTSTGEADKIMVNSKFTKSVFHHTFKDLKQEPWVVYPGIDTDKFMTTSQQEESSSSSSSIQPSKFLSINRYEKKKGHSLALESFHKLLLNLKTTTTKIKSTSTDVSNLQLIIAGGYDERVTDNVETLKSLQELAKTLELKYETIDGSKIKVNDKNSKKNPQVLFVKNLSDQDKIELLTNNSLISLLYTAQNEHFGIVPLEAMSGGVPVLACNSGGPTETVIDLDDYQSDVQQRTGYLRKPDPESWSIAMTQLYNLDSDQRSLLKRACRDRVKNYFSLDVMTKEFSSCIDILGTPNPNRESIYLENSFIKIMATFTFSTIFIVFSVFIVSTSTT